MSADWRTPRQVVPDGDQRAWTRAMPRRGGPHELGEELERGPHPRHLIRSQSLTRLGVRRRAALHCSIRFMRSAGGAQTPSSRLRSRRSEGDLVSFPPYTFPLLLHHRESSGWLPGIRSRPTVPAALVTPKTSPSPTEDAVLMGSSTPCCALRPWSERPRVSFGFARDIDHYAGPNADRDGGD